MLLSADTMNIFFISEPDEVYHRSRVATDSTSWDKQACTHDTLWLQRVVTNSKKYSISSHILLKYFELIFIWLKLVQISCNLIIIWLSYERKKTGAIFMKHHVYRKREQNSPFLTPKLMKTKILVSKSPSCCVLLGYSNLDMNVIFAVLPTCRW